MGRRTTTSVLIGIVLTLLVGCGKQGCTDLPVDSGIRIQIPKAIQKVAPTLLVELCQDTECRSIDIMTKANQPDGEIAEGVTRTDDAYDIDLARFGTDWKAATVSGLTITGTEKSGRVVLKRTDQFTFDAAYPNGEDCDDAPSLTYSTSVGGGDLVE